ncbi:hypothetical protein BN2476_210069 [Paraburkholderia piptadeniae]|uniref:Uncharacterized protein n=1 Tax=Paraburkholderia piptadeniae TaxID=1701573 RepID=A0A1N7RWK4_9BURK|nr:hypothetical protein BN2476_210069 [Paraburkholderia piptadeniae]
MMRWKGFAPFRRIGQCFLYKEYHAQDDRPVKPEPTITTSTSASPSCGPSSSGGSPAVATQ